MNGATKAALGKSLGAFFTDPNCSLGRLAPISHDERLNLLPVSRLRFTLTSKPNPVGLSGELYVYARRIDAFRLPAQTRLMAKTDAPADGNALQPAKVYFSLIPRQEQVYDALVSKTPQCAKMYFGAIKVWSDSENPEKLYLAAHSLRELMNNIGPYLDVPLPNPEFKKGQGGLNEKFAKIEKKLAKAEKSKNCTQNGWSGTIHTSTESLLIEIQTCVKWRIQNEKFRKTKGDAIMSRFDPLYSALPEEIQSLRVKAWEATRDYFVKVAHHHPKTEATEFDRWLLHLEEMLLKGLAPVAKQNLTEMDEIIKAGEVK